MNFYLQEWVFMIIFIERRIVRTLHCCFAKKYIINIKNINEVKL